MATRGEAFGARTVRVLRRAARPLASLSVRRIALFLAAVLVVFHVAYAAMNGTDHLREGSHDTLVKWRLSVPDPDPRIVVVDIDEASLARMAPEHGLWPWPRDTLATLLGYLESRGARAVVFDVLFADPDAQRPGADRAFADAVAASRIAYLPVLRLNPANDADSRVRAADVPGLIEPIDAGASPRRTFALVPPYFESAVGTRRLGTFNVSPDPDGTLRTYRYSEDVDGWRVWSLPARVALDLTGQAPTGTRLIDWRRAALAYPRVPFADVYQDALRREPARPADEFAGRIVIVGSTATGLHDARPTPLSPTHPGADILASALDGALNGRARRELPAAAELATALGSVGLVLALVLALPHEQIKGLLLGVPVAMMAVSFATLQWPWTFVDLSGAAASALAYFSVVEVNGKFQTAFWTDRLPLLGREVPIRGSTVLAALLSGSGRPDRAEDAALAALIRHAPDARMLQRPGSHDGDLGGGVHGALVVGFVREDAAQVEALRARLSASPQWAGVVVERPRDGNEPRNRTVARSLARLTGAFDTPTAACAAREDSG